MRIAILGYDTEGKSSFEYFARQGHELEIRDQSIEVIVPEGVPSVLGDDYLKDLDKFDVVVRTAGLPPHKILAQNPSIANKITSQTNEFFKVSPTRNIIGVTGTKGKGTTSTLITKMLEAAGYHAQLGGNIGTPPLALLPELTAESWVVLELSSFQLSDIQASPHIGVCLMVAPEHLNWHHSMDDYAKAKANMFAHQTAEDIAIYFSDSKVSHKIVEASPAHKIPYFATPGAVVENDIITINNQAICQVNEVKLLGMHNWQNICAAVTAVWQITQDVAALKTVLTTFAGLPFRLELVRELDGVRYYNDSFGTTPETAMVAVQAFETPEIVILGGQGKGVPFDDLAKLIAKRTNVKQVITIGQTGPEIAQLLHKHDYHTVTEGAGTMPQIVAQAQQLAEPGDVVLLSTACASFDMFKSYKDRGEQFTAAVQALASTAQ